MASFLPWRRRSKRGPGPPPGALTPGWAARTWTSADGLALYARDYAPADGPARVPVICMHGLTRNSADFENLAPWIAAQGRRVLAPDVRGRGRSAWDPNPMNYAPATYAADVLRLMDEAGIARALFVGTSMGGLVTMAIAGIRPFAVAGAVLNDVGPSLNPEGLRRIGAYTGQGAAPRDWDEAAQIARAINGGAFPHYSAEQWRAFAHRLFQATPDGKLRLAYDPDIAAPIRAAGPGALAPDLTPLFLSLAAGRSLMLIQGERSDLLDEGRVGAMRAMAPHMDYVQVKGVGHAPMLDEPEALVGLERFLDAAP